ncbi:hypothetical protein [Streptomyces sp. NPDC048196]|uniref:hypothetical protein n=1 Tax=Streptomyces sp. NPDC048196 TaxID=3154712 RepID=UPI0033CF77E7
MTQDIPPLAAALPPAHGQANASALIHNGAGAYLLHLRDDIPGIWEPGAWSLLVGGQEPGDRSPRRPLASRRFPICASPTLVLNSLSEEQSWDRSSVPIRPARDTIRTRRSTGASCD